MSDHTHVWTGVPSEFECAGCGERTTEPPAEYHSLRTALSAAEARIKDLEADVSIRDGAMDDQVRRTEAAEERARGLERERDEFRSALAQIERQESYEMEEAKRERDEERAKREEAEALAEVGRLWKKEGNEAIDARNEALLDLSASRAEAERLTAEALRFYLPDGSYETLATPEEVVERRIEAARTLDGYGAMCAEQEERADQLEAEVQALTAALEQAEIARARAWDEGVKDERVRAEAESARLTAEALRFYRADGTYETLSSPEEVVERRKAAARDLERVRGALKKIQAHADAHRRAAPGADANQAFASLLAEIRAARALALPGTEAASTGEDVARLINGLIEAGDLLMNHVQRIDWDPRSADMARECWLESRAAVSGDLRPKHVAAPAASTGTPPICTLPGCKCIAEARGRAEAAAWWDSRPKCRCGRPTTNDGSALRCLPCQDRAEHCKCNPVDGAAPAASTGTGEGKEDDRG